MLSGNFPPGIVCIGTGILIIMARFQRWKWFNDHYKVRNIEDAIGTRWADLLYLFSGIFFIVIGVLIMANVIPARFDSNTVYVALDEGKTTLVDSPWALSNVIHEALHIEQGFALSHSIEGERLAWQAGLRVYQHFSPSEFYTGSAYQNVLDANDTKAFLKAMWDPEYRASMMALYPEYPGGPCPGPLTWCTYIAINSQ